MLINSSAPTRIDLAGGTLDIWPIYLFHPKARTVNVAINQRARTKIEQVKGSAIEIKSEDQNQQMRLASIDYAEEVEAGHPLELIVRLLEYFQPEGGLNITTNCMSPAGAGLGGSSALCISLVGALNVLTGCKRSREDLITIAKNIETRILKIPAGVQDYYPAMYGGLNSVMLEVMGDSVLRHSHLLAHALESRMLLVYSGKSRNSGGNNWTVTRSYLDGDKEVHEHLGAIQEAAATMEVALRSGRYDEVTRALDMELEHRKLLTPGIATPEINDLIDFAKKNGARSAKICGAGGGGCVMFWTGGSSDKQGLAAKLREKGVQVIDFRVDSEGLAVTTY